MISVGEECLYQKMWLIILNINAHKYSKLRLNLQYYFHS